MSKDLEDRYTRMAWREKEELYRKYLARQRFLEEKAEYEAECRRDNELTEGI